MKYEDFKKSLKEVKDTIRFPEYFQRYILYPYIKEKSRFVKPVPKGNCMFCDKESERANPVIVDLCPSCARKVVERNTVEEKIAVKEKINFNGRCYLCKRPSRILYHMNVRVCQNCLFKFFKRGYKDMQEPVIKKPLPLRTSVTCI